MSLRLAGGLLATTLLMVLPACEVEQTREGELPEVEVEPGRLPEYDIDPIDVDIIKDTQKVVVPKVKITPPRRDTLSH